MAYKQLPCSNVETTNTYEWKIPNFSLQSAIGDKSLISPIFFSGKNGEERWRIEICFEGIRPDKIEFISIYLKRLAEKKGPQISAACEIAMINPEKKTKMWIIAVDREIIDQSLSNNLPIIRRVMPKRKDVYLVNDTLTIRCEIRTHVNVDSISEYDGIVTAANSTIGKQNFASHMKQFFNSADHSDVTIIAGNQRFPAHKVILSARSIVFSAMFSNESMTENQKNEVKIKDLTPEVVKKMLYYIYTDEVGDDSSAIDLLVAAEKYQLEGLKSTCELELVRRLNASNAAETLLYADLHNALGVKKYVMDYIRAHEAEVGRSTGFKDLMRQHPVLGLELYQARINDLIQEEDSLKT